MPVNPIAGTMPPIRKPSPLYLGLLLAFVLTFYFLLLAAFSISGYALYKLVLFTPTYIAHVRGGGAFKLLAAVYLGLVLFLFGLFKAATARIGGDPVGLRLTRSEHPAVFSLTDEVARRVGARPIDDAFLTPEGEVGVWEETGLFMPPGVGKRKIVLGMGALSCLTTDQLRSVLAHEYGHFSNKDTFFSRFIHRVALSYGELVRQLSGSRIQLFNPLYWLIRGFVAVYRLIASSFSRQQEIAADRFAAEAFGPKAFAEALATVHIEGNYFNAVGIRGAFETAKEGKYFCNLYNVVAQARWNLQHENPQDVKRMADAILASKTKPYDSHPALCDRLVAIGQPAASAAIALPTRPVAAPTREASPDNSPIAPEAAMSAAEDLFGERAIELQEELSKFIAAKYHYIIEAMQSQKEG